MTDMAVEIACVREGARGYTEWFVLIPGRFITDILFIGSGYYGPWHTIATLAEQVYYLHEEDLAEIEGRCRECLSAPAVDSGACAECLNEAYDYAVSKRVV